MLVTGKPTGKPLLLFFGGRVPEKDTLKLRFGFLLLSQHLKRQQTRPKRTRIPSADRNKLLAFGTVCFSSVKENRRRTTIFGVAYFITYSTTRLQSQIETDAGTTYYQGQWGLGAAMDFWKRHLSIAAPGPEGRAKHEPMQCIAIRLWLVCGVGVVGALAETRLS